MSSDETKTDLTQKFDIKGQLVQLGESGIKVVVLAIENEPLSMFKCIVTEGNGEHERGEILDICLGVMRPQ